MLPPISSPLPLTPSTRMKSMLSPCTPPPPPSPLCAVRCSQLRCRLIVSTHVTFHTNTVGVSCGCRRRDYRQQEAKRPVGVDGWPCLSLRHEKAALAHCRILCHFERFRVQLAHVLFASRREIPAPHPRGLVARPLFKKHQKSYLHINHFEIEHV